MKSIVKNSALWAGSALILTGCGGIDGRGEGRPVAAAPPTEAVAGVSDTPVKIGEPYTIGGVTYTPADIADYDDVGYASWYGDELAGRPTANGEVFNPDAISAAHTPLHAPPAHLHTYALSGAPEDTPYEHYCAMVQAMDTELGRLLAGIPAEVRARTTVILIGDNGSPQQVVIPPSVPSQSKGSLFEGGVRVPLVISGHQVAARGLRCQSLVQSVDLFPTIVGLFGADLALGVGDGRDIDGIDLGPYLADVTAAPLRPYVVVDRFEPNGFGPYTAQGAMIRDPRWKLIRRSGQPDAFFDLEGRDREDVDLNTGPLDGEQQKALAQLQQWLDLTLP